MIQSLPQDSLLGTSASRYVAIFQELRVSVYSSAVPEGQLIVWILFVAGRPVNRLRAISLQVTAQVRAGTQRRFLALLGMTEFLRLASPLTTNHSPLYLHYPAMNFPSGGLTVAGLCATLKVDFDSRLEQLESQRGRKPSATHCGKHHQLPIG
jgi:hypothetical protein